MPSTSISVTMETAALNLLCCGMTLQERMTPSIADAEFSVMGASLHTEPHRRPLLQVLKLLGRLSHASFGRDSPSPPGQMMEMSNMMLMYDSCDCHNPMNLTSMAGNLIPGIPII
ncbi:hypothetical protein AK812_SmicGene45707, partial [Symbiodinium microadriaticum]